MEWIKHNLKNKTTKAHVLGEWVLSTQNFQTFQRVFSCSKLTIETLKNGVKYVQS